MIKELSTFKEYNAADKSWDFLFVGNINDGYLQHKVSIADDLEPQFKLSRMKQWTDLILKDITKTVNAASS